MKAETERERCCRYAMKVLLRSVLGDVAMKSKLFGLLAGIGICALAVQPAEANTTFFFSTPAGSTCGGQACSARAEINLDAQPNGVVNLGIWNTLNEDQLISTGQALSGFSFTLSNAPGIQGSGGVSGQQANVGAGGCNVPERDTTAVGGGRPSPSGRHWDFHRFG